MSGFVKGVASIGTRGTPEMVREEVLSLLEIERISDTRCIIRNGMTSSVIMHFGRTLIIPTVFGRGRLRTLWTNPAGTVPCLDVCVYAYLCISALAGFSRPVLNAGA